MPSIIQTDRIDNQAGSTTYLNSGTLDNVTLGTATVFPAGKIIQAKEVTLANFSTSTTTTELGVFNNASSSFTISSTSNHVLVYVMATVFASRSSTADVYATISEGTTASISTQMCHNIAGSSQGDNDFSLTLFAVDTSPASTTPQYVFTIQRNTSGTASVNLKSNSVTGNKMFLMEIKQ